MPGFERELLRLHCTHPWIIDTYSPSLYCRNLAWPNPVEPEFKYLIRKILYLYSLVILLPLPLSLSFYLFSLTHILQTINAIFFAIARLAQIKKVVKWRGGSGTNLAISHHVRATFSLKNKIHTEHLIIDLGARANFHALKTKGHGDEKRIARINMYMYCTYYTRAPTERT